MWNMLHVYKNDIIIIILHLYLWFPWQQLFEMKFEMIRVVCSHEHYIALNLPLQKKGQQTGKNFKSKSLKTLQKVLLHLNSKLVS